jgi:hypothetical protein
LPGQEIKHVENAVRWLARNCPKLVKNSCPDFPIKTLFFKKLILSKLIDLKL